MNYKSTRTFESKVQAGVSFTIRKINVWHRDKIEELQAEARGKLTAVQQELAPLAKRYREAFDAAMARVKLARDKLIAEGASAEEAEKQVPLGDIDFPDVDFRAWKDLTDRARRIDRLEVTPIAVRFCLVRVEDLMIDGQEATFDSLYQDGPDGLYEELAREIAREMGLLPQEAANLPSPSTSTAAVDGNLSSGSADPAGKPATTIPEAAPSSTDPKNASVPDTPPRP